MADPIRRLPDAELTVMQAVWACPTPVYRTDLEEALRASHPMAPTTLLTLLSRLAEKGFLAVEKEGREGTLTLDAAYSERLSGRTLKGEVAVRPYEVLVLVRA